MNFIYQQRWSPEYSTELNHLMIDVIEYRRNQGLLEKLDASPYEGSDCLKCQEAGKGIAESKCLECHKEIKPFLDDKKGFHGQASKNQTCIQCHSDHKGRTFDTP